MPNCIPNDAGWLLDEFDAERFWNTVHFHGGYAYMDDPLVDSTQVEGECWFWARGDNDDKYGRFRLHGKWQQAHRIAFRDFGNKIEDGHEIDHLCRTKRCIRPSHLEAVTHGENMLRGANAIENRTHCRHGHPLAGENIMTRAQGRRMVKGCRTCFTEWKHRAHEKTKMKAA